MALLYLGIVFLVIVILLAVKRPLYQAVLGGILAMVLLFKVPFKALLLETADVFTTWSSLSIILSMYLITFLQRMLEARKQIKLAQMDLDGIFHNRRINSTLAPIFIGLLPSAAAMLLCGDIVKDAAEGHLKPKEQAVVASWFRHIPESYLPTYSGVLLMMTLSGVPLPGFLLGMTLPVIALFIIGYVPYLRKLPKDPGTPLSQNRPGDALHLFRHLWTLLLILLLILGFQLGIVPAVAITIGAAIFIYRFRPKELAPMIISAFEKKLILNTFLVLVLKEVIDFTGVLNTLPELLSGLPVPTYLVFCLIFFLGTIISGTSGIIALGTPMAFAIMPDGGMPLMVLLMCITHAASQVSPIHICLVVAADYFKVTMGEMIRKTIPLTVVFCIFSILYYQLLLLFF